MTYFLGRCFSKFNLFFEYFWFLKSTKLAYIWPQALPLILLKYNIEKDRLLNVFENMNLHIHTIRFDSILHYLYIFGRRSKFGCKFNHRTFTVKLLTRQKLAIKHILFLFAGIIIIMTYSNYITIIYFTTFQHI